MKRIGMVLLPVLLVVVMMVGCDENSQSSGLTIDRDITMYVPVRVGGALDVRARIVAEYLSKEIGVNVSVLNVVGAGGAICATQMLTQPTTEYDLFFTGATVFGSVPAFTEVLYTLDDFTPLAAVDIESFGLYVSKDKFNIEDFDELMEYTNSNELIYGSGGIGNVTHLLQAKLYDHLGMNAQTLTHNGAIEGVTNCMGGHNVVTMAGIETVRGYVESGDIIPVMTFDGTEYTGYEGYTVPSVLDVGGEANNVYHSLMAIYSVSKLGEEYKTLLQDALLKVLAIPECQADLKKIGLIKTPDMTTKEIQEYLQNEYSVMSEIVQALQK